MAITRIPFDTFCHREITLGALYAKVKPISIFKQCLLSVTKYTKSVRRLESSDTTSAQTRRGSWRRRGVEHRWSVAFWPTRSCRRSSDACVQAGATSSPARVRSTVSSRASLRNLSAKFQYGHFETRSFRVSMICYLCASLSFVPTHQAHRYRYACKARYQARG